MRICLFLGKNLIFKRNLYTLELKSYCYCVLYSSHITALDKEVLGIRIKEYKLWKP